MLCGQTTKGHEKRTNIEIQVHTNRMKSNEHAWYGAQYPSCRFHAMQSAQQATLVKNAREANVSNMRNVSPFIPLMHSGLVSITCPYTHAHAFHLVVVCVAPAKSDKHVSWQPDRAFAWAKYTFSRFLSLQAKSVHTLCSRTLSFCHSFTNTMYTRVLCTNTLLSLAYLILQTTHVFSCLVYLMK